MIPRTFDDITKADIDALVTNQVREGREIEYKKELPAQNDDGRREFLGDASSFANASSGDLIFGVEAKDGIPVAAEGVAVPNADQLMLQFESIVRDGLDPRLLGLRTKVIPGFTGGSVIVMRIQRSWAAPHMIKFKGLSRFFTRNSAGKHQMDVTEIRSAFLLSEGVTDKVRRFRERRIATILAEETPVPMESRSMIVLHLIPMTDHSLEIQNVPPLSGPSLLGDSAMHSRYNIDGFVVNGDRNPKCNAYCQLFRTGALEAVNCNFVSDKDIPLSYIEPEIIKCLSHNIRVLDSAGVPFPLVFACSLIGVRGKGLPMQNRYARRGMNAVYDRDQVHLPDVLIETVKADLPAASKPLFDSMWQGVGMRQSPNYDANGNWMV